jgi:hypothetical protein
MMMLLSPPPVGRFLAPPLFAVAILAAAPISAFAHFCGCTGNISTYCTSGTSVQGCVTSISGVGIPNVLARTGFDPLVCDVPGQRWDTIFYGFYSYVTSWAPIGRSFKCIASPVQRMNNLFSGVATTQCNGELRVDFNAWMATHPAALGGPFVQGQTIRAQAWYRDPPSPKTTNLPAAIRFVLCP